LVGDETEQTSHGFVDLTREHDHLVRTLAKKPGAKSLATIRQLLDEMALHHPACADYLRGLANRAEDFR
jgi:hypothetical protein